MKLPAPETGLVIRYAYLWRDEAMRGQEEGVKDRPCAVVLALKRSSAETTVLVAPITHTPPRLEAKAIEIPASTAQRLGLDELRSWIMTHEVNSFVWPGPDLRPAHSRKPEQGAAFGFLPKALADRMVGAVREHRRARTLTNTDREVRRGGSDSF